ncbi:MAG TPA: isoaspartyl peptidase/L-asparaginase [Verrucomicrobiae bacterium]|jgi:beta-aspartyl-peptidase (threonine type)
MAFVTRSHASDSSMQPFGIVIHGGAGTIRRLELTPGLEQEYRATLRQAVDAGYAELNKGGTSLSAVEAAIVILEDSPLFNAGKGAVLTSAGAVELDAAVMDGKTHAGGAVTGVTHIKNPIQLARVVMEKSPHVLFQGDGAEKFAKEQGFTLVRNSYFIIERRKKELQKVKELERQKKSKPADAALSRLEFAGEIDGASFGTVGAVALDKHGNLAAGTSTGGRTNKRPGRVGDTPILGAGTYADNRTCAVSATGHGEFFMRAVAGHDVAALMEYRGLTLAEAMREVLRKLGEAGGTGGMIAIDGKGNIALPFNTAGMYRGHHISGREPAIDIFQEPK